ATFTGDVYVLQGDTEMRCKQLVVFYEQETETQSVKTVKAADPGPGGDRQIRRIEAKGNVVVTQRDQNATGDAATFNMRENTVTLVGNVVVTRGADVLRGQRLVVDLTSGVSKMDQGRVEGLFQSAPRTPPEARNTAEKSNPPEKSNTAEKSSTADKRCPPWFDRGSPPPVHSHRRALASTSNDCVEPRGFEDTGFAQHPRVVPTPPRAPAPTKSGKRRLGGHRPDLAGRADAARPRQEGGSKSAATAPGRASGPAGARPGLFGRA